MGEDAQPRERERERVCVYVYVIECVGESIRNARGKGGLERIARLSLEVWSVENVWDWRFRA